jgi:hypothetical protein
MLEAERIAKDLYESRSVWSTILGDIRNRQKWEEISLLERSSLIRAVEEVVGEEVSRLVELRTQQIVEETRSAAEEAAENAA